MLFEAARANTCSSLDMEWCNQCLKQTQGPHACFVGQSGHAKDNRWYVPYGDCKMSDGCISSPNFPEPCDMEGSREIEIELFDDSAKVPSHSIQWSAAVCSRCERVWKICQVNAAPLSILSSSTVCMIDREVCVLNSVQGVH